MLSCIYENVKTERASADILSKHLGHQLIALALIAKSRQLEMVNQANGKTLWKKTFSSQIGGYVVVY